QPAVAAQAWRIFKCNGIGAGERAARTFDHGRLVTFDIDLEDEDATVAKADIVECAVEITPRDALAATAIIRNQRMAAEIGSLVTAERSNAGMCAQRAGADHDLVDVVAGQILVEQPRIESVRFECNDRLDRCMSCRVNAVPADVGTYVDDNPVR